ncbi:MAG: TlpA family protein disulfide reductase [Acidobacteria bacterium]|nr:TlpA family protein disulfide reductase [Acidobacteriota bacterium]
MKRFLLLAAFSLAALSIHAQPAQPEFVTSAMDGSKVDTRALRGKVVVLNLWFINCPNCLAEIKMLNQLVDEYKGNPDVVFLAPAASPKNELVKFSAKNPFKYQVIPDSSIIIVSQFGSPDKEGNLSVPFPMHYVMDRDGKIATKAQGIKGIEVVRSELKKQFPAKGSD